MISLLRSGLLLLGLGGALLLRLALAGNAGSRSVSAGLSFAIVLAILAAAAGWRPSSPRPEAVLLGLAGAAGLVAVPALLLLCGMVPHLALPATDFPVWALVVTAVAVAEELVLRGVLITALQPVRGAVAAVLVSAVAFALLHVPLYGWRALPLDLAAGLWLGGLRLLSGNVGAPAVAHAVADLAAWGLA